MNPPATETSGKKRDCSWLLLGVTSISFLVPLWILSYFTYYTEGEVGQIIFKMLIGVIALCAAVGFYRRVWGVWLVVVLGGILISWESYQLRNLAMLREDAEALVRYVERYKTQHEKYPADISGFEFTHKTMKSHIHRYSVGGEQGFYFECFLNSPSLTYRYTPAGGHRYYPD